MFDSAQFVALGADTSCLSDLVYVIRTEVGTVMCGFYLMNDIIW